MTASKQKYRGFDIEQTEAGWVVSFKGERKAKAPSEQSAFDYIDIEKHRAAKVRNAEIAASVWSLVRDEIQKKEGAA